MKYINADNIDDLSLGSVFLATGGGGDPYVPQLLAKHALKEYGAAQLVAPNDLDDEAHVIAIGAVGAPTVSLELLPSIAEVIGALEAYEKLAQKKVDALVSFEIGGGNSLIPIIAAAVKGIPIIDGDGMGRALPEAQMMTFAISGAKPTPAAAIDYAGNICTFKTESTLVYERHIRAFSMAAGGMITAAEHPMSGRFIKQAIIPGTVSFAIKLGQILAAKRSDAPAMLPHLISTFADSVYGECRLLFCGKVIDKSTRVEGGFDIGEATLCGFEDDSERVHIRIKNEYLLATKLHNGKSVPLAMVPDLIIICDFETSEPINAERLSYGQRVAVFAVQCPDYFASEKALAFVQPKCFGIDLPYQPLTELKRP